MGVIEAKPVWLALRAKDDAFSDAVASEIISVVSMSVAARQIAANIFLAMGGSLLIW